MSTVCEAVLLTINGMTTEDVVSIVIGLLPDRLILPPVPLIDLIVLVIRPDPPTDIKPSNLIDDITVPELFFHS